MEPDCTTCRYFRSTYDNPHSDLPPDGECHMNPPTGRRLWPSVRGDDWCGQHQPVKESPC